MTFILRHYISSFILLMLSLFLSYSSFARLLVDPKSEKRRFSFATTYISGSFVYDLQDINYFNPDITSNAIKVSPGQKAGALGIGALHFWNRADFFVEFENFGTSNKRSSVDTGAHIYPLPIIPGSLRPFVGISWLLNTSAASLDNKSKIAPDNVAKVSDKKIIGPTSTNSFFPLYAGLSYRTQDGGHMIQALLRWIPANQYDYLIKDKITKINMPSTTFKISYKKLFESTADSSTRRQNFEKKFSPAEVKKILSRSHFFNIGAGPSTTTSFVDKDDISDMKKFSYNLHTTVHPDLMLGYYNREAEFSINLSFRFDKARNKDYRSEDSKQYEEIELSRKTFTVEAIKFLFDYYGFVPFVGPGLTYETTTLTKSKDQEAVKTIKDNSISPTAVFGWDIRPNIDYSNLLLRTNLRYTPNISIGKIKDDGMKLNYSKFEFNFIQAVFKF